jgi:SAM-dependent methyltransferase
MKKKEISGDRVRSEMDEIYKNMPQPEIPWNNESPPPQLTELIEGGRITPCRAVDLGCGAGNYAIWLADKGYRMTGIDISPEAIRIARENALTKGACCTFLAADLTGDITIVKGFFDFAFDWDVLHHVFPEKRNNYAANIASLLNPGGSYLSVCFHEQDPQFGGTGKYRTTRIGTRLYFSSGQELEDLFKPFFTLLELKKVQISGKAGPHIANWAFMTRR